METKEIFELRWAHFSRRFLYQRQRIGHRHPRAGGFYVLAIHFNQPCSDELLKDFTFLIKKIIMISLRKIREMNTFFGPEAQEKGLQP